MLVQKWHGLLPHVVVRACVRDARLPFLSPSPPFSPSLYECAHLSAHARLTPFPLSPPLLSLPSLSPRTCVRGPRPPVGEGGNVLLLGFV